MSDRQLHNAPSRQRGVAIITAVLVIALGSITMVAITASQQLDMQRERNEGVIQQARAFGISGERFAAALLYRDIQDDEDNKKSDSLEDEWALTIPPIPIDNASIQGCVLDMQGRFNLNNLIDAEGKVVAVYQTQFIRLLRELKIDANKAAAVIDWIDSDIDFTGADGAEDEHYTGLEVGYLTANTPFTSVSELQLVKGFSNTVEEEAEDFKLLLPHIAVLPKMDGVATAMNVNTATPELLASVSDDIKPHAAELSRWETLAYEDYPECENIFDLDTPDVQPGAKPRIVTPWEAVEDFKAEVLQLNGAAANAEVDTGGVDLSIDSRSFQVRIDVEAEGIRLSQFTLLERDAEGKTKVVYRSRDTL